MITSVFQARVKGQDDSSELMARLRTFNSEIQSNIMKQRSNHFGSTNFVRCHVVPPKPIKKKIFRCPHVEAKHYAKGMCNQCYHVYGRQKLSTNCEHTDRLVYAKGVCQSCYFRNYNSKLKTRK